MRTLPEQFIVIDARSAWSLWRPPVVNSGGAWRKFGLPQSGL